MLLLLLPFFDRSPERHPLRRPIAMVAGIATIAAMAYLTVLGALAGSPTEIELATAPQYEEGQKVTASSGCLGCHKIGENGNTLGPNLTEIGSKLGKDAIARTLVNPTSPMPSYQPLRDENPEQFDQLVEYVASLKGEDGIAGAGARGRGVGHAAGGPGARDVRPHRGGVRPHELGDDRGLHHRWRERAVGSGRRRRGHARARRGHRHR